MAGLVYLHIRRATKHSQGNSKRALSNIVGCLIQPSLDFFVERSGEVLQ